MYENGILMKKFTFAERLYYFLESVVCSKIHPHFAKIYYSQKNKRGKKN